MCRLERDTLLEQAAHNGHVRGAVVPRVGGETLLVLGGSDEHVQPFSSGDAPQP